MAFESFLEDWTPVFDQQTGEHVGNVDNFKTMKPFLVFYFSSKNHCIEFELNNSI